MATEWKPGDVAMVECSDGEWRFAYCNENLHGLIWQFPEGAYRIVSDTAAHPVAVIDPEDTEQVERLADALNIKRLAWPQEAQAVREALREFATPTPPKPEEPLGLGAVVNDSQGATFIRHTNEPDALHWLGPQGWRSWAEIDAVRILSEGVPA